MRSSKESILGWFLMGVAIVVVVVGIKAFLAPIPSPHFKLAPSVRVIQTLKADDFTLTIIQDDKTARQWIVLTNEHNILLMERKWDLETILPLLPKEKDHDNEVPFDDPAKRGKSF